MVKWKWQAVMSVVKTLTASGHPYLAVLSLAMFLIVGPLTIIALALLK